MSAVKELCQHYTFTCCGNVLKIDEDFETLARKLRFCPMCGKRITKYLAGQQGKYSVEQRFKFGIEEDEA